MTALITSTGTGRGLTPVLIRQTARHSLAVTAVLPASGPDAPGLSQVCPECVESVGRHCQDLGSTHDMSCGLCLPQFVKRFVCSSCYIKRLTISRLCLL